jgi:lanthanide-dependent methanol dehydrogenase
MSCSRLARGTGLVAGALALFVACRSEQRPGLHADSGAGAVLSGSPVSARDPNPAGEWPMQAGNDANWRYSELADINTGNAHRLAIAWTFSTGENRGHEGAPLVVGNTMYLVTPYPNVAYALDLTKPPPHVKWRFEPNPAPIAIGKACCDVVNRGWAIGGGKLIYNLLDAHTVAVDLAAGRQTWRTKMDEVEHGVTMTMAPLVVKDMVLVGNSGGEMGVHGWIAALDVAT